LGSRGHQDRGRPPQPDEGTDTWQGEEVRLANPIAAMRLGIKTSYQDLNLFDGLSLNENIYLGHE
jgi:ribose transport system ATP-binding protein